MKLVAIQEVKDFDGDNRILGYVNVKKVDYLNS